MAGERGGFGARGIEGLWEILEWRRILTNLSSRIDSLLLLPCSSAPWHFGSVIEVTGCPVIRGYFFKVWHDFLTGFCAFGTATIETADVGVRIDGAARFASEGNGVRFGFKAGDGGDEGFGIGVAGVIEDLFDRASFDNFAEIHDQNAIAQ